MSFRLFKLALAALRFLAIPVLPLGAAAPTRRDAAFVIAITLTLMVGAPAAARTYHVDARAIQAGNGTTWSKAWNSFGAIEWLKIEPGDTILVSGGIAGLVHRQSLVIQASGTAGKPIRIAPAMMAGHNGPVTIDGQGTVKSCVVVDGHRHITIENFSIQNCTREGIRIRNASDIVARGNTIFALSRGFHIWRTSNVTVSTNNVTTPTWTSRQTDGIYSESSTGNRYISNRIVISNGYPDGHDDGIQSHRDRDILFSRNYVEQRNEKTGNALGIFLTDAFGLMKVIDNVVVGQRTRNSLISLLNVSETGGVLSAYNNTLVGSKWGVIQIENAPMSVIANNILYSTAANAVGITIAGKFLAAGAIDRNLYYLPNGHPGYHLGGISYDWNDWRALGYEARGMHTDIAPFDASLAPSLGSRALDSGATGGAKL